MACFGIKMFLLCTNHISSVILGVLHRYASALLVVVSAHDVYSPYISHYLRIILHHNICVHNVRWTSLIMLNRNNNETRSWVPIGCGKARTHFYSFPRTVDLCSLQCVSIIVFQHEIISVRTVTKNIGMGIKKYWIKQFIKYVSTDISYTLNLVC
jgi:hypothetical protein